MIEPTKLTDKDLRQHLANAYITYRFCVSRHSHKAKMNMFLVDRYKLEYALREKDPPVDTILYTVGKPNGLGSFHY